MTRLDAGLDDAVPERETRRALPVLLIWTAVIIAISAGTVFSAYKIYVESFTGVDASSRTEAAYPPAATKKRRDASERQSKSPDSSSQVEAEKPANKASYEVFSASKLPAISPESKPVEQAMANPSTSAPNRSVEAPDVSRDSSTTGSLQGVKRRAVPFALQSASARVPVGPLALRLEAIDARNQRYSANVCIADKCILLSDRAIDEVAAFSVPENTKVFEMVVTRISHNQVSGYVMVPAGK